MKVTWLPPFVDAGRTDGVPSFVAAVRRIQFSSLWAALTPTVHINALYIESMHGNEEHATWINTIPLKISHLFGFSVSNRWSQCDSLACLRLDSRCHISMFDSNHFICDTSPLFCLHGHSFPCACSISANSTIIGYISDCLDRLVTVRERMSSGGTCLGSEEGTESVKMSDQVFQC